jgi:hypothetical protein
MNLLVLPFYASTAQQLQHGRCGNVGTGLLAPPDRFLPFVLKRPATGQGLDCVRVFDAHTGQAVRTILPAAFPVSVYTDGAFDYYTYFGNIVAGLNLACGRYFLEVKSFFSEVFEVRTNLTELLKIEFGNSSDIAGIPYSAGFVQRLYLDAGLAEPTYKHEEDGEDDGDKVFVPLAHRLIKSYKFDTAAIPEFLVDVLSGLAIHNKVTIGGKIDLHDLELSPTWAKDSCAASASVTFAERPVLAAACASTLPLAVVDVSGYVAKPWLCGDNDDQDPFWENTGETRCVQAAAVFLSAAISEEVYRNNCPAGKVAGSVFYRLPAGHVADSTSQVDVDARARLYFDQTKQAYANASAACNGLFVELEVVEESGGSFIGYFTRNDTTGPLVVNYAGERDNGLGDVIPIASAITIPDGQLAASKLIAPPAATYASVGIVSTNPSTYAF